jgi:hypothetical protein
LRFGLSTHDFLNHVIEERTCYLDSGSETPVEAAKDHRGL